MNEQKEKEVASDVAFQGALHLPMTRGAGLQGQARRSCPHPQGPPGTGAGWAEEG